MDYVETEGDTIDKAIENALKLLGVERDKITVDILSEGKKGILGFGAQKARIRATPRKSAIDLRASELQPAPVEEQRLVAAEAAAMGQKAKEVLAEILNLMGISAEVELRVGEKTDETVVEIRAENSGLLIGRKGQTLEALQYLVSRIAGERGGTEGPHIVVDIENYRQRRRKSLEDMAFRLG
jgi:spoIIIJ-associated protein